MSLIKELLVDAAALALLGLLVAGARHVHDGKCGAEGEHGYTSTAQAATHR